MGTLKTEKNSVWYKDAVIYEVRVRAMSDSNGDGIGDFRGLAQRLDYLQDLGVTTLWLLPFYPSPMRDDGYDISNYTDVHPSCGTLQDFKFFLREAHRRGLRVVTELIINHTSDQHPWFQRARKAPAGSRWRKFYVWSDTQDKYQDARIIFKDFEPSNWSWDPVAKAYYWHRFYAHQPDLNFDNPEVRRAIFQAVDFWLDMGVDGLRLDAVPYLYEREGTNCENLSETHAFLKDLRKHVDKKYQNRMLLAEANQWPEDAVPYFGAGDECHMAFHFPIMPRMFMAVHLEDRYPIIDIFEQTPGIPDLCQWALFLRNHDELTLEMVTDEERDYMYRVYASDPEMRINLGIRRRLAPLLGNNRRKIELMNGLLFSLPGTPVLYYGDEIGMGDNVYLGDRNGVRTPMQWSGDRNAGFSKANPQKLYAPIIIDPEYHYEAVNVEAQQNNPHSLFWWTKRLIALRKKFKAFGRGSVEFLTPSNPKVFTFIRRHNDEILLVVANLSRFVQCVELNLSAYKDMVPVELFGQVEFPPIGELPYFITMGPHNFFWFSLKPKKTESLALESDEGVFPQIEISGEPGTMFRGKARVALEELLPGYMRGRRWFGGKARKVKSAKITEQMTIQNGPSPVFMALVQVDYFGGSPETYVMPLAFAAGERKNEIMKGFRSAVLAEVQMKNKKQEIEGILFDGTVEPNFSHSFLGAISNRRQFKGNGGNLQAVSTGVFRKLRGPAQEPLEPSGIRGEQSNSSIIYGDRFILKLFRKLENGVNPDLEIGRFLTDKKLFEGTPAVAGYVEFKKGGASEPMTVALLHRYVQNEGDAWNYTLNELGRYFEKTLSQYSELTDIPLPSKNLIELVHTELPELAVNLIGPYLESARLLGQRTAELHMALSSASDEARFQYEPFTQFSQRGLFHSLRGHANKIFSMLREHLNAVPDGIKDQAREILAHERIILQYFDPIRDQKLNGGQIRCHGDFHLGQILFTGKDFIIIDFEGEPARSLTERRLKRSPLRDVAGMLRSFHYAAYAALQQQSSRGTVSAEALNVQEKWVLFWTMWTSATYLKAYLETCDKVPFLPKTLGETQFLLNVFLLDKAIYEVGYELNNRPDWLTIPFRGMLHILGTLK